MIADTELADAELADDLFAGAGGWDVAAGALGIHARGVENMPAARATRAAAGLDTIHDDVWTFEPDGKAKLSIASAPCQTFSQAGSGSGRKALDAVLSVIASGDYRNLARLRARGREFGDDRTALVLTPLHFAVTGGYRALAWEQVPSVLPVWEACADVLRARGWSVWAGMLHAEQYGTPQTRKRALLLASLDREVKPPTPTHSRYHSRTPSRLDSGVPRWVSMAEGLGWAPEDADNYRERFAQQSDNVPDYSWPWSRPATVVAGRDIVQAPGATANRYNGSTKSRNDGVRVTVEEAAALQGFPPMEWCGDTIRSRYLQVGNAIPPLLALHALRSVIR